MDELSEQARLKAAAKAFHRSFPLYSKNLLRIVDRNAKLVPFRLNAAQRILHDRLEEQKARTGMVRMLVLKGRQEGVSTYVQGRFFQQVATRHNLSAFVLSHLEESTTAIFEMAARFYDNIPHPAFKPPIKKRTTSTLSFAKLNSRYRVGTARSGQTGRSQTNQLVHGSEVAYYPNADLITSGLLQTVANMPGTEIILESTANGAGGWFYDRCMEALEGRGDFELAFLPWFLEPSYRRKVAQPLEKTEEEEYLCSLYGLDDEQVSWRRAKIHELGEDLFKQEYPCNPKEAFLQSGRSFVEPKYLDVAELNCWSPAKVGEMTISAGFIPSAGGRLKVWVPPSPNERYCIGVDVAEGLERGDYSCAQVLDSQGNQVACWHGHEDPMLFGDIVKALALYYRKAWVLVERNNHGLTTIRRMQDLGYPNLYVEQEVDNAYSDKLTKRAGWLTTTKTKPLIVDNLSTLLRQERAGIADKDLIAELRTYVVDAKGRTNAQRGCYDDRVMSYAIALFGLSSMPRNRHSAQPFASATSYTPVDDAIGF